MKFAIEKIVQLRNPQFRFDDALSSVALLQFAWIQFWGICRGLKLLLILKKPKWAILGSGVRLFNFKKIHFGKFLKLGNEVRLSALGNKGIQLGNNVGIGSYSQVIVSTSLNNLGSHITIGDNVGIGEFAYLGGGGGLDIGNDCIVGQYFSCHPENHQHSMLDEPIRLQGVTRNGISIGSNCWIGAKVTILDGVVLGGGCIVAAGAVVTKSFEENSIIGGVPAKLIKKRNERA